MLNSEFKLCWLNKQTVRSISKTIYKNPLIYQQWSGWKSNTLLVQPLNPHQTTPSNNWTWTTTHHKTAKTIAVQHMASEYLKLTIPTTQLQFENVHGGRDEATSEHSFSKYGKGKKRRSYVTRRHRQWFVANHRHKNNLCRSQMDAYTNVCMHA